MFLQLPFQFLSQLQQTVLVVNTVLLLGVLIVVELVYSETPREKREHLKYFAPLLLVLIGLLVFAAYKQIGRA
jgi:Na+/serine symporter